MKEKKKRPLPSKLDAGLVWEWVIERYRLVGLLWIGGWCVGAAVYSVITQDYSEAAIYSAGVLVIAVAVELVAT
jgi:hypothetical protein